MILRLAYSKIQHTLPHRVIDFSLCVLHHIICIFGLLYLFVVSNHSRFEELAEVSRQHAEVLREAQRRGNAVPKYHTEECVINTFK